jgi:hypothetical protein
MSNVHSNMPSAVSTDTDNGDIGNPNYDTGTLVEVAGPHCDGIGALEVFGDNLYGGAGICSQSLVKWNGTDAWNNMVTGEPSGRSNIISLLSFGGILYGGNGGGGQLISWDQIGSWVAHCPRYLNPTTPLAEYIYALIEYDGNMYAGTGVGGPNNAYLMKAPGAPGTWIPMATYAGQAIHSLAIFNNQLFCGTSQGGLLLRWDDVSAFDVVAPIFDGVPVFTYMYSVNALTVFKDELYATGTYGPLLKWNGVDDWIAIDNSSQSLSDMIVFQGQLYACGVHLWIYNEAGSRWQIVATGIETMYALQVFQNKLFASGDDGYLYRLDY